MTWTLVRDKWWALGFVALSSCGSADDVTGNLGNGSFSYVCVSTDDPACASNATGSSQVGESPASFPALLAEGAHFKMTYDPKSSDGGNPTLKPVAPEYISALSADGSLTALKAGKDAVVARSTVSGLVYDYTYVTISPISSLGVTTLDGSPLPTSLKISTGGTTTLVASALGPRDEKLAGAVDYTWTSSDDAIVHLEEGNPTAHVDFDGMKAGTATLTVTQGTMTVTIPITVSQ
jgi:hypothetical protein